MLARFKVRLKDICSAAWKKRAVIAFVVLACATALALALEANNRANDASQALKDRTELAMSISAICERQLAGTRRGNIRDEAVRRLGPVVDTIIANNDFPEAQLTDQQLILLRQFRRLASAIDNLETAPPPQSCSVDDILGGTTK